LPLASEKILPRTLAIVTVRPRTPRAAVAPSATTRSALPIKPPSAALDFPGVGAFMKPPLAALLELEVFDSIGDKDLEAVKTGIRNGAIEYPAGRADERTPA